MVNNINSKINLNALDINIKIPIKSVVDTICPIGLRAFVENENSLPFKTITLWKKEESSSLNGLDCYIRIA